MSIRIICIRALQSIAAIIALVLITSCILQRKLLYHPTHKSDANGLNAWTSGDTIIGLGREVPVPKTVWLFIHGNSGQAADRTYALPAFSEQDSIFILEFPGYGNRVGSPSLNSFNTAAKQGYDNLREKFPNIPIWNFVFVHLFHLQSTILSIFFKKELLGLLYLEEERL